MLNLQKAFKNAFQTFTIIFICNFCLILVSCNHNGREVYLQKNTTNRSVAVRQSLEINSVELILFISKQPESSDVSIKTDLVTFTNYLNKDITNKKHSSDAYEVKRSMEYQRLLDTIVHIAKTSKTINVENIAKSVNYIQKFGIQEDEYFNNMISELLDRSLCVVYLDSKVVNKLRIETFSGFDGMDVNYYIDNTKVRIWQTHF